jgi:DNA repair exonuclease SbcCD nuclease subunit
MKVLFIGDPHIRPDNIPEIEQLEKTIDEILEKNTIDFIVVGGDILHTHERLHTLAMNRAIDFLKHFACNYKVYCLVGNHDLINNQQFLSRNHWMTHIENLPNIFIVEKALRLEKSGKVFAMVPYVWPGRFIEAMEVCDVQWKDANCIFAHQEFKGCKMGAIISEIGDEWNESYPLIISGHIHDNQRPQKNIYYPGTPIQHSFGDAGKNVVAIIDVRDDIPIIEEIYTGCSSKKTLSTTLEKIDNIDLEKYEGVQLRVSVSGDATSLKVFQKSAKFKELQKAGIKVALKPVASDFEEVKERIDENGDFIEILTQLIKDENNKTLMSDFQEIVMGYGEDSFVL